MKLVKPSDPVGLSLYIAKKYAKYCVLALTTFVIFSISKMKAPVQQKLSQSIPACLYTRMIPKGERVSPNDLVQTQLPEGTSLSNIISECNHQDFINKPVLSTVFAGDLAQYSNVTAEFTQNQQSTESAQRKLLYLNVDDLHSFPPDLYPTQSISILGKSKEMTTVENVATSALILEISTQKNETGGESISKLGLLLAQSDTQKVTKALAEKWSLHILQDK